MDQLINSSTSWLPRPVLEKTLRIILEQLENVIYFDSATIFLIEKEYARVVAAHGLANTPEVAQLSFKLQHDALFQEISRTRRPLILDDAQNDDRFKALGNATYVKGWLGVPLIVEDEVIGCLTLDSKKAGYFNQDDANWATVFVRHAALAIQNAQLFQAATGARDHAHKRAKQLMALHKTAKLTSYREIPHLIQSILEQAVELLQAKGARLYVFREASNQVELVGASGELEQFVGLTLEVGNSVVGRVINTQKPFFVSNYHRWPHRVRAYDAYRFKAVVGVPVTWENKVWGAISIHDIGPDRQFTDEEATILSNFGNLAAIALENAELLTKYREQKKHWARLIGSSPVGIIALDSQGVITEINEQAQNILSYSREQVIGQPVDLLYADPQESRRVGQLLRDSAKGKLTNYETILHTRAGVDIPIRLAATWLYDTQGQKIGSVGYFEDLRHEKETENQLDLMLEANNTVAHAENLRVSLQRLTEILVTRLDITFCRSFLIDESGQYLMAKAAYPDPAAPDQSVWQPYPEKRITIAEWPEIAEVMETGVAKILRLDTPAHRSFLTQRSQRLGLNQNIESLLLIPLQTRKKVVGLLGLAEFRPWDQAPFSPSKKELAVAIADQTVTLIDRMQRQEETNRREQLLQALTQASLRMRGEREPFKLMQEMVRLAAELVGCTVGGLFINNPSHSGDLRFEVTYKLPDDLIGSILSHSEGLLGKVAMTGQTHVQENYSAWPDKVSLFEGFHFETLIGTPLKVTGAVEAVLFVASDKQGQRFDQAKLDILEQFAAQAALAYQTSRLMTREQRMFQRLTILHKISDYIQAANDLDKILHVVLTGVTAGYGLSFNRAALFLLEGEQCLVGRMGVGHLEEAPARKDWAEHHQRGMEDFVRYFSALEQNSLEPTPVETRIRGLRLPLSTPILDPFSQVIQQGYCLRLDHNQLKALPDRFIQAFKPSLPLVVIPLQAREQIIGLLVADNKFTSEPITGEDIEVLELFANTAAIAINNAQLFAETKTAQNRLSNLFEASNALVSSQDPENLLQEVVGRALVAAKAAWVSLARIDPRGAAQNLFTAGIESIPDVNEVVRPDGLSRHVMETGKPIAIENAYHHQDRVNPIWSQYGIEAALCLPLLLQGDPVGVMWVHYEHPRRFMPAEIDALQLYANQAAIAYDAAQNLRRLETMRQTAAKLAGAMGREEVLAEVVEGARRVMEGDSASLFVFNARQQRFTSQGSVTVGIPKGVFSQFCEAEPWQTESKTVIQRGWIGVEDINDEERYQFLQEPIRDFLWQLNICSFQGMALVIGQELKGVLYVNYRAPRRFSFEASRKAQTFADMAVQALKRASLSDQVGKAHKAARMVAEVTILEDLPRTLNSIAAEMRTILDCSLIGIWPYDSIRQRFSSLPALKGVREPLKAVGSDSFSTHLVAYEILKQDDSKVIERSSIEALGSDSFLDREDVQSFMGIPLITRQRKVGSMLVGYRRYHRFTEDELNNIRLFAYQAALAIGNAQLYKQIQQRAGILAALSETSQAVTGSLELTKTLNRIVEGVGRLVQHQEVEISFSCIRLIEGNKSRIVAAFPPEKLAQPDEDCWADGVDLTGKKGDRIGIMGRAAVTGQSQIVGDVREDPDYITCNPDTHSELAVPIKLDEQVIGVLNAEHPKLNAFDEIDLQTLHLLAQHAGIAIKNARLFEERERHAQLLEAATQVARGATNSLDVNELLDDVVCLIVEYFQFFYHAAIFLLDEKKEYAVLQATSSEPGKHLIKENFKLPAGETSPVDEPSIVGHVAESGELYLAPTIEGDPYHYKNPLLPQTRAEMTFPLIARRQIIGVLDVQSKEVIHLSKADQDTLQTMADQLANAIHNAQLYEREQLLAKHLAAIYEVSLEANDALDINQVSQNSLEQIVKTFKVTQGCVIILDSREKHGQIIAAYPEASEEAKTDVDAHAVRQINQLLMSQSPIWIDSEDANDHPDSFQARLKQRGVKSTLLIPLWAGQKNREQLIGVISLENKQTRREFNDHEVALAQTMATQLAAALRLLQSQEKLRAEQTVNAAFMLLSRWAHKVRQKSFALDKDLDNLRKELPAKLFDDILDRMHESLQELSLPAEVWLTKSEAQRTSRVVDLASLLNKITTRLCQEKKRSVKIEAMVKVENKRCFVRGNQLLLSIAMEMLVENAVWSIEKKGLPGQLTVTCRQTEDIIKIAIQDTGGGIPADVLKDLFHNPVDSKSGFGYGSFTAASILKSYQGTIRVESTGPEGTSIECILPAVKN